MTLRSSNRGPRRSVLTVAALHLWTCCVLALGFGFGFTTAQAAVLASPTPVTANAEAEVAKATGVQSPVLAVIGTGPAALTVTEADFERAFRLAVGELLNRQGLPLRDDLFEEFAPSRSQFLDQFIREKKLEFLARAALPNFKYVGPPRIGLHSFAQPHLYADYLTGAGFSNETDYLQEMARQALLADYREQLQSRFSFSEAAVRSYYVLNRRTFTQRYEACVRHILLPTQEQARDLRSLLIGGADFALLARTQSRDAGSAVQGGELGCVAPRQTVPAFDAALFGGTVGVPQVVRTDHGWHVLEVTERHEAGQLSLEQATPHIRRLLAAKAATRLLEAQLVLVPVQLFGFVPNASP